MVISLAKVNLGGGSGGGGSTTVIDNLESTSSTAALSARQGKVIGDHISDAEYVVVKAQEDLNNQISNKLERSSASVSDWSNLAYYTPGFINVRVNNVQQGWRLHIRGADSELTNPRIDQITTSETVLRIVSLTQDEYDALVQAGTLNNNTLYAIIPDNS